MRTSLQTRLIKTGGRLVVYALRLVFQLAEVLVTRELLGGILERMVGLGWLLARRALGASWIDYCYGVVQGKWAVPR